MVLAARRAYSDATRWMREARPPRAQRSRFAGTLFTLSLAAGVVVLGAIALLSPARYGSPGARPFGDKQVSLVILVVVLATTGWLLTSGRRKARELVMDRRRALEHPARDGAADALTDTPGPFRTRFAVGWVWGPMIAGVFAAALAFSSIYFLIDALLARFDVGWEQPAFALGDAIAAFVLFRALAGRIATLPVASAAYRAASEA
jgi:hypothetical protein